MKLPDESSPDGRPCEPDDPCRLPLQRLEVELTELAAHINAATCRWLSLVAEFDRRDGWAKWGCKSCAAWLSWRCGLGPAARREQLRVARRLAELPTARVSFGRGELSYSQVRALTRSATADTEGDLVELARHATAAQLEVIVRAHRGVLETGLGGSDPKHRRRWMRCQHDDDGALLLSARLPAEEGALVLSASRQGGTSFAHRDPLPRRRPKMGTPPGRRRASRPTSRTPTRSY